MNKNVLGLMLAATVAVSGLAGCQSPAQSGTPTGQVSPAKQQAGAQTSQSTAQAMSEERESENYGYLADDAESAPAGYAVQMVGQPKPKDGEMAITVADGVERDGEVNITTEGEAKAGAGKGGAKATLKGKLRTDIKAKLDTRKANLKAKAKAQLDKLSAEKESIGKAAKAAKWVDNGDGTETKTIEFSASKSVKAQTATRTGKMVRTRNIEDKTLVSTHYELSATRNGMTRTTVRDKVLQADGSYKVTFHSEMTFKDGTKRVADWSKTITADGAVSGTGTIVWTGKMNKTVNLTFGGTEEAETATTTDPATQTETTVTTTVEGTATAVVKDTTANTTTTVAVEADADAAVATTETSASADASASTTTASPSPAASASPAATESPAAAS